MKQILILIGMLLTGTAIGQQPQFIMPLWFEDAIGNRDTIWVGADYRASYQNINPQFGERAITSSFDSIFEVRAVHSDDDDWETSKVIVDFSDFGPSHCPLYGGTRIMIQCRYLPVTISWDTTLLATNYPCNVNAIFSHSQAPWLLQYWYEADGIYCLMTRSSLVLHDLSPAIEWGFPTLSHPFEVEGMGVVSVPGLYIMSAWDYPYCYTLLPTEEIHSVPEVMVSPNPANTTIRVGGSVVAELKQVRIMDLYGRTVAEQPTDGIMADVSVEALSPGMYLIEVQFRNGMRAVQHFVKL